MGKHNKQLYVLGNILRGWFEGRFVDSDEAWRYLSRRFLLSYPCASGRSVALYVHEKNYVLRRVGITWRGALPRTAVLRKCQRAGTLALNP